MCHLHMHQLPAVLFEFEKTSVCEIFCRLAETLVDGRDRLLHEEFTVESCNWNRQHTRWVTALLFLLCLYGNDFWQITMIFTKYYENAKNFPQIITKYFKVLQSAVRKGYVKFCTAIALGSMLSKKLPHVVTETGNTHGK